MEIHSVNPAQRYPVTHSGKVLSASASPVKPADSTTPSPDNGPTVRTTRPGNTDLDSAEYQALRALQQRDREVRAHEQAHLGAAGRFAVSGASFDFERGPDGRLYAVGGEVSIDTSPIAGDPAATLQKAETIRRAALAPSDPSAQDRRVAVEAGRMAAEARAALRQESRSELSGDNGADHLARRLADSGAVTVTLQSESAEQLDVLI